MRWARPPCPRTRQESTSLSGAKTWIRMGTAGGTAGGTATTPSRAFQSRESSIGFPSGLERMSSRSDLPSLYYTRSCPIYPEKEPEQKHLGELLAFHSGWELNRWLPCESLWAHRIQADAFLVHPATSSPGRFFSPLSPVALHPSRQLPSWSFQISSANSGI